MIGLDLNPPWVEGIRNTVYDISQNLLQNDHKIHYITKGYVGSKNYEKINGIYYHRIITSENRGYFNGSIPFLIKLPFTIPRIINQYKIDVVHGHSIYPFFGAYLGLCLLPYKVKKIITQYSFITKSPNFKYSLIYTFSLKFAKMPFFLEKASFLIDKIIVTSKSAYKNYVKRGIKYNKLYYVPIGIDINKFNPLLNRELMRKELSINMDDIIILFAGDLTPYKGVETLIKAVNYLIKENIDLKCIILSKDTYEYEYERKEKMLKMIKKYEIFNSFYILGIRKDIQNIFICSDIVVLPFSKSYALMDTPRALIEAMACGRPVIASDVGGISEIIEPYETGILIKGEDYLELALQIKKLIFNKNLCIKLSKNSRSLIASYFNIEKTTELIEKIYKKN
jgi:glycosyltransferase involved in cell wall biosynthesis